jgi:uncharacterized membrane protein (DUF106 family)
MTPEGIVAKILLSSLVIFCISIFIIKLYFDYKEKKINEEIEELKIKINSYRESLRDNALQRMDEANKRLEDMKKNLEEEEKL